MKQIQQVQITITLLLLSLCPLWAQQNSKTPPPPSAVGGSGTTDYIPLWTSSSALGNSVMYQTNSRIGINTTSPQFALDVNGRVNTAFEYAIGETVVLATPGGENNGNLAAGPYAMSVNPTGINNTAVGNGALNNTTNASANTAVGNGALLSNNTGGSNTAVGYSALTSDQDGAYNTAVGAFALFHNTAGDNTALGYEALYSNSGSANTASGVSALEDNTLGNNNTAGGAAAMLLNISGSDNTAYGGSALENNTTGVGNIAIGYAAAASVSGGNSNNIHIGSAGVSSDSGTIRIGTSGTQTSFFAAGVRGVTTGESNAIPVVIDSNGQLGTVSSSRRFKTDIQDMGQASSGLMRLRPVTFRYKKPFADGSQPIQYGLIAEEVAEIYPDLVARSSDGEIESVKYQVLDPMLLNELQRQQAEIRSLQEQLNAMEAAVAAIGHGPEGLQTQTTISQKSAAQGEQP